MKKILPVVAVIVLAGLLYYVLGSDSSTSSTSSSSVDVASNATRENHPGTGQDSEHVDVKGAGSTTDGDSALVKSKEGDEDTDSFDRPATEIYKTADDALKALKAGAADYDDRILEQFTEVGPDCSWCEAVYSQVKELMLAPDATPEQRSYYAELLAVSGHKENVASLIDAIKNAPNQEIADSLSEALELAVGKNDVVQYLGDQLGSANDSLRESLVAALTNQGSRLAADILYQNTVAKGDPDGYYSLGIGLGELVPDESAMPYLQELVLKRDQYSHLAVKSLLNSGLDGLKLVINSLNTSSNSEFDSEMLKDAIDHVPYDDEIREYLEKEVESEKNPTALKFAKDVLALAKSEEGAPAGDASDGSEVEGQ